MKKIALAALLCLLILSLHTNAQISGTVFKDFNFNGTQQTSGFPVEPGVYGVQVKAFNAAGTQVGPTKTTNTSGAYNFTVLEIFTGTAVRIEFTVPGGSFDSKVAAGGNGSSVQFVTAPATGTNYAIASQQWYSNTANPWVATNSATNGDPLLAGTAATNNNLFVFPYTMRNTANTLPDDGGTNRLPNSQLGSVYGLASQKSTRTVFMAAYLKRHAGFGPSGIGAIYKSVIPSATGTPAAATLLVNVSTIGINVGTDPRAAGALPAASITRNADPNVFGEIGKRGIGGIALNEDGTSLYLVNMFQNKLHRINIGSPLKTSFTAADVTGSWALPNPATTGMVWHPMACKSANGKIYVGGVVVFEKTTAHVLNTDTVGARGIVYEFDTSTAVFTEVLRFPFNYRRAFANADPRYPMKNNWWCAWQNNGNGGATDPLTVDYNTAGAGAITGGIYYPQPMIADIEFDVNGEMVIGVRDRFGDQMGYQNLSNDALPTGTGFGAANNYYRALSSGEVLRAGKNIGSNSYSLESLGAVINNGVSTSSAGVDGANPSNASGNWTTNANTPWGGSFGPGWGGSGTVPPGGPNPGTQGAYFYFNHNFSTTGTPANLNGTAGAAINGHYFKSDGSLALLAGSGEVMHTMMDPMNTSYTQGVGRMNNSGTQAGNMSQRLQLTVTASNDPSNMGKAGGMCDLEILTDYQPVEIGNRVWNDVNGNGLQDAGETGINGVTVQLTGPGVDGLLGTADDVVLATTTSSATGEYYFNTLTTADTRKPASFIGVGANDILPGFAYQVRINPAQASLTGYRLSATDAGANGYDNIDNDGAVINSYAAVNFNTAATNHNFDFGFKTTAALGDRVWLDNGSGGGIAGDGLQNGSEPGVAGVPVMLYRNGTDGAVATTDDVLVGATITDAYGNFFFDNLTPTTQTTPTTISQTSYNVRITAPANYSFATQTNTIDDNLTTGASVTGSDVNPLGLTYSINLSNGEVNQNIDAGLIFRLPAVPSSIGDHVWFDKNLNGFFDATEPGVSGVTVTLFDNSSGNALMVTTTDADGFYNFTNLPVGDYYVGFTAPGGTVFTTNIGGTTPGNATTNSDPDATTGETNVISIVAAGTQITGIDAGIKTDVKGALGDFVWNDLNRDGIQNAGEPGIPNVTVKLYGPGADNVIGGGDDFMIATTITDAKGFYKFSGLDPAKYFIVVTPPAGYTLSPKDVTAGNPAGDLKDNDFSAGAAPYAGKDISPVKTLLPVSGGVTRDLTIDLGLYNSITTLNSLGDYVWNDANRNGLQDAGEIPAANITARLLTGAGATVNCPATGRPYILSTDSLGYYKFADLADGNYIIEYSNLPGGYSFTKQDATGSGAPGSGTDGTTDSDVKTSTGRTVSINLDAASANPVSVNINNVDAGIYQGADTGTASIGNRVWFDMNTNNLQDAGETGAAGIKAELLDGAGAAVDGDPNTAGVQAYIVYTNALGEYLFTGLDAGDYKIRFSNFPIGYSSATVHVGTDDTKDADANFAGTAIATTNATTATYTLQQGEDNMTADMGIFPAATLNRLGDFVWNDLNANGKQDSGEPGVQGVTVSLYTNGLDGLPGTSDDVLTQVTTTDTTGKYAFVGLADGNYNVGFTNLPAGFKYTAKDAAGTTTTDGSDANTVSGRSGTVALDPTSVSGTGVSNFDTDAGLNTSRAAIGNYVWTDLNRDGVQDATESGVAGATIILYASDATTVLASAVTDAYGKYYFNNLNPGTFIVGFGTTPGGLSFTQQNSAGDNGDNTNSDADPATGKSAAILLSAGESDLTIDAGLRPDNPASVGDYVWNDLDMDGVQDINEPGVPGVLVTLYDNVNTPVGAAITDGNGRYSITKVAPGTGYYIGFSNISAGAIFTTQTSNVTPTDATLGSDADPASGKTAKFALVAGQYLPTVDAGLRQVLLLPVKMLSFTARPQGGKVQLDWQVAEQENIGRYEAQFSMNGNDFTTIATVTPLQGNNAGYTAYHLSPVHGINYYRIRINDKDGHISYSEIRKVNIATGGNISLYPVPANNFVNITLPAGYINKNAIISIIAADGKIILQKTFHAIGQTETIDLSRLPGGMYALHIVTDEETISKTIEVAR